MTGIGALQIITYLTIVLLCVKPLGWYMAQVYENKPCGLDKIVKPIENTIYRICRIVPTEEMPWKKYLTSMLIFNFFGMIFLFVLLRLQHFLPFNPLKLPGVEPGLAFNTAVSFASNTNWQAYVGETTLSYFSQMVCLTTQNFISAATGLSLLVAFIRGLIKTETSGLGNFWVDVTKSILYILLPFSIVLCFLLSSLGVIQNLQSPKTVPLLQTQQAQNVQLTTQQIPMGPAASQTAIKILGSNGGGFFGANSAHPLENPTPLTNFLEMLGLLLIPAAFCYTFGLFVRDTNQGWAILLTMLLVFVPLLFMTALSEQRGNPKINHLPINVHPYSQNYSAGNLEGKETRFGIVSSSIWSVATTASSNGSVNSSLDSYLPLSVIVPLWLMQMEEIIFGGIGSGLLGMLIFVIISVFLAGLMVGRTPEYLGKKIEPYEIKMACFSILIMPLTVLAFTAFTVLFKHDMHSVNSGSYLFTEILYAFTSAGNNNGSSLGGLLVNTPYFNLATAMAMLIGRYFVFIPVLAIAGSLARKKTIPAGAGTLPTNQLLFVFLLLSVIFLVGALTFLPALSLGPIVEHIRLWSHP